MIDRHRRAASLAILVITMAIFPLKAKAFTGEELSGACATNDRAINEAACVSYVRGFMDGMLFGTAYQKARPNSYCPPNDGISLIQARSVILNYLQNHPAELHKEAAFMAAEALVLAYPCK